MKKFLDFKNFNFKWNKESAFIIILAGILCLVVVWPASGSPAGGGRKASGGGMASETSDRGNVSALSLIHI